MVVDYMNKNNTEVAASSIKAVTEYRVQIANLQDQIRELEEAATVATETLSNAKVADGWKKFEYYSSYYGSHTELGEGDEERTFLFHPSVDSSRWDDVSFSHGHRGQSDENEQFGNWLSGLPEGHYIEL